VPAALPSPCGFPARPSCGATPPAGSSSPPAPTT